MDADICRMFWQQIKDKEATVFKRLTGVHKKTFRLMVREVNNHDLKKVKKKGNSRSRPFKLSVEDQILLTLMYYREYRTQFHIGGTYQISESAVSRTIQRIESILSKADAFKLPGKAKLSGTRQEYEVILIDATEMSVERPKKSSISTTRARKKGTP
jgi:hypothetical protein